MTLRRRITKPWFGSIQSTGPRRGNLASAMKAAANATRAARQRSQCRELIRKIKIGDMFPLRANTMAGQPLILLVEDLVDDVFVIRYALRQTHVTNPIEVARDGEEARAYLQRAGNFADGG